MTLTVLLREYLTRYRSNSFRLGAESINEPSKLNFVRSREAEENSCLDARGGRFLEWEGDRVLVLGSSDCTV